MSWRLYFTTDPGQDYQPLSSQVAPTGIYMHTNLVNETQYWYRIVGVNASRESSAPTYPVSATPKEDPLPPGGWVMIDNGAEHTSSANVTRFDEASREPFSPTRSWRLEGPGRTMVFVQFRDSDGNESKIVSDSIFANHHLYLPLLQQ